ncbi:MAG: alpha/beta hydrolase fold domain-containing protein, partial [Pseudomonadales bacterium]|nr:alpha/beta hydrolase fold domain-containing protein [Pseudomonadales bacterium]
LTLASLLRIRDNGLPQPAGAFCVSPWTNLTATGSTMFTNAKADPIFAVSKVEDMVKVARFYAPDVDLTDPYISPAFGDFTGLAPLLIYAGSTEILLNDAQRVVAKAKEAGVPVEFKVWSQMPHSFHVLAGFLPEGKKAIRKISNFVHQQFDGVDIQESRQQPQQSVQPQH